jgi:hypothetical protein
MFGKRRNAPHYIPAKSPFFATRGKNGKKGSECGISF